MKFYCDVICDGVETTEVELPCGSVYFKCYNCGERVYTAIVEWNDRYKDSDYLCKSCQEKRNILSLNTHFANSLSRVLSRKIEAKDIEQLNADARLHGKNTDISFLREYFKDYPPLDKNECECQTAEPSSTENNSRNIND